MKPVKRLTDKDKAALEAAVQSGGILQLYSSGPQTMGSHRGYYTDNPRKRIHQVNVHRLLQLGYLQDEGKEDEERVLAVTPAGREALQDLKR